MQNADEILGGTFRGQGEIVGSGRNTGSIERAENQLDAESSKLRAKLDQVDSHFAEFGWRSRNVCNACSLETTKINGVVTCL